MNVEYTSNNSGGHWWLTDEDWAALEKDGWHVEWVKDDEFYREYSEVRETGRWLGALARSASKDARSLKIAIAEWEFLTEQSASDRGCSCCGEPHNFTAVDEKGNYIWD